MANEYIYLLIFNLILGLMLFHDYLAMKNENKNTYFGKEEKNKEQYACFLSEDEWINQHIGSIIERWEKKEKSNGMSLEEYIDKYFRTHEPKEEKIDIEELKYASLTDEEFFDKYIIDIVDDWEKNVRPNGISLNQYLCDNYKKVQEDEKCAKIFVDKVIKISHKIIGCEWQRLKEMKIYNSCKEFVDREYRGTEEEKEKKLEEYFSSLDFDDIVKDWKRETRFEDILLKDFIKREYNLPINFKNDDKILEKIIHRELKNKN